MGPLAQQVERWFPKPEAVGSNPTGTVRGMKPIPYSIPPMWRNGRRSRFKICGFRACGFESLHRQFAAVAEWSLR